MAAKCCCLLVCCALWAGEARGVGAEEPETAVEAEFHGPLVVEPDKMLLVHRRRPHSILAGGRMADGSWVDLTRSAVFTSAHEQVARVDSSGWVEGIASGTTAVTVSAAGYSAQIEVTVALSEGEAPVSFRHEVMPVLSKAGCNQGACHGYSLGKNGFRLSLRGGDEAWDYQAITREFQGRRLDRQRPEASLLVSKPVGDMPHGGGMRLARGDLLHRTLGDWIAQGAPGDLDNPLQLETVAVHPERIVTGPGRQQQLQVLAGYSDGSVRDVTRLAVYTSNSETLAEVDPQGLVTAAEPGETAVVVRFERVFDVAEVTVLAPLPGFIASEVPQDNLVDRHVTAKLNEIRVTPSPPATDAEYLRRVYIDLIGLQPTPSEVRGFLADTAPNKREAVVEAMFERSEYVDHWSLKWGDLLQNSRRALSEPAMWAFREWIRGAVASNLPLDRFAHELLTASGDFRDDPAAAFYLLSQDENATLERVTQVFCGVRMLCAKCHNHPFENWTQRDYYGLASFFNQVVSKPDPLAVGDGKAKVVALDLARGFAVNPRAGAAQPPRLLGAGEVSLPESVDRREAYARWLTSAENPFFARSLVNRYWSYFFHRGIIEPVDDLRSTNPPVNPALLEALAADFVAHGHDARHLIRMITSSRTYRRSSQANELNSRDELNFSRAVPRRLRAEVILDCLVQASGVPESFADAPAGFSAAQLPDGTVSNELLSLFGKPQRMEACECERSDGSNLLQALHFINGKSILDRLAQPASRVETLLAEKAADAELVDELYLWSLARLPSDAERGLALAHFQAYAGQRREAAQDLMWALLNSKDFLFND